MEWNSPRASLYLNRRAEPRVQFRKSVRFNPDRYRPLRKLEQGVTQDVSLRGLQILTTVILDTKRPIDLWVPVYGQDVIRANARVQWVEIEADLGDSPYWIRSGLSITLQNVEDRQKLASAIAERETRTPWMISEAGTKIGFVF